MMMKKKFNFSKIPVTGVLAGAAAVLLVLSAAGSSQAALTYYSENYSVQIEMFDIGVTLMENDEAVSWRNYTQKDDVWVENTGELLANMIDTDAGEKLQPGKLYEERLSVLNSGNIDEYVRVSIYRYWKDQNGNKFREVSPELIDLHFTEGNGWILDERASTDERMVFYYSNVLPTGQRTPDLSDTLKIDESVAKKVTKNTTTAGGSTTITTTYDYDGISFVLEAEVDAVQTHNAEDAIKSAWGVDVSANGGVLSLK